MKKQTKSKKCDMRIHESDYDSLKDLSIKENTSVSNLIRDLLFKQTTALIDLQKSYLVNQIRLSGLNSNSKKQLLKEILRNDISYNKKN